MSEKKDDASRSERKEHLEREERLLPSAIVQDDQQQQ
jgi:hypothetical protein